MKAKRKIKRGRAAKPPRATPTDPDAIMLEGEAARLLSISMRTLQAWRVSGHGPRFVRCGRAIRYRRIDLLAFVEINTVRPSA